MKLRLWGFRKLDGGLALSGHSGDRGEPRELREDASLAIKCSLAIVNLYIDTLQSKETTREIVESSPFESLDSNSQFCIRCRSTNPHIHINF